MRYDIAIFDTNGNKIKTIISECKPDRYEASVEEIYYMKSKGYIILKVLRYNGGGKTVEKIMLNDYSKERLFYLPVDNFTDDISFIPSPKGTFIAFIYSNYRNNSENKYNVKITFLDSIAEDTISKVPEINMSTNP